MGAGSGNQNGELVAVGRAAIAGLPASVSIDSDLVRGRYALREDVHGVGRSEEVYDGTTVWAQDISGGVHPYETPFAQKRAITSAYLNRRAYFDARTPATIACIGSRFEDGRWLTVVRVTPAGGIPADMAIDSASHLLASVSETLPAPYDDGITRYADYRTVGALVLPFSIERGTQTSPTDGFGLQITRYELLPHVRDAHFARPTVPDNSRMIGGAYSTTVPMSLESRELVIWASIDGRPAMPFILDTGGHDILTTVAAHALGLRARGAGQSGGSGSGTISTQYARVQSVRIGSAELIDQPFLVIPYPYSFYERGKRTPLAGILGLEFFERFAVRLDYGERTVTFTPLATYRPARSGPSERLMFEDQEDMPVVGAAADGHPGLFGTDTGNSGPLILFGHFLESTGLGRHYSGGEKTIGIGTGGSNSGRAETLGRFTIANHTFNTVASNFTNMASGSFASTTEAGNMGVSILSRFIPTFDYANETLRLDPEKRATSFGTNRTGIHFLKEAPDAFEILTVDGGSAGAAEGIVAGDRIVGINGKSASGYSRADLTALVCGRTGTRLVLRILHAGAARDVTLQLRS